MVTPLRLRRRDYPLAASMVVERNEHGQRSSLYDYQFCYKNYQPGSGKDYIGDEAVPPVSSFCDDLFFGLWNKW